MNEIYFQGFWRMDWGFGNPNKTAALIAVLMVAVWSLAYLRRSGFWVALMIFTALGVCLVHTFSRGGVVAAAMGLCPVILAAPRPWPKGRVLAVVGAVWVIVGASVFLQAHERLGQGISAQDPSISNRLAIWQMVPTMMCDAPAGWGIGNSGRAYMEWYQPLDRGESYRTLVGSHWTWLVEFGWPARFLYVAFWVGIFVLMCPGAGTRWLAVPLGVWLSFFAAAGFSSVAESYWLWTVPVGMALWVLGWRIQERVWPDRKWWILPPVCAGIVLHGFVAASAESPIRFQDGIVYLNGRQPRYWVMRNAKVLGERPGRPVRAVLPNCPQSAFGFVECLEDLPKGALSDVIVAGDLPVSGWARLRSAKRLLLANPRFHPDESGIPDGPTIHVFLGEFAQSAAASAWAHRGAVKTLSGVGDYLPDWPQLLLDLPPT